MRLTVLRQKAVGVNAKEILEKIERIKHYLWHGNVFQALQHIEFLQMDVDCIEDRTAKLEKLEQGVARISCLHSKQSCSHPKLRRALPPR